MTEFNKSIQLTLCEVADSKHFSEKLKQLPNKKSRPFKENYSTVKDCYCNMTEFPISIY